MCNSATPPSQSCQSPEPQEKAIKEPDLNPFRCLPPLKLAVVGHQEWVTFLTVDSLPEPGRISRSLRCIEEPAGAGAVVAVQLARLTGERIPFFTALGNDAIGHRSVSRLRDLGVDAHVAWRDCASRRGISLATEGGDRAITVIGERLTPSASDSLPWDLLSHCDGAFVSASDVQGLRLARQARVLTATPRLRQPLLQEADVELDALIGSGLDPDEQLDLSELTTTPRLVVRTCGQKGGSLEPGGRYVAVEPPGDLGDSYGCGDSFAAGMTAGLAAGWSPADAAHLGATCGAACASRFGPY